MQIQSNRWVMLVVVTLAPLLPLLTQSHVLLQHDYFLSDLHHSHLPIRAFIGREIAQGSVPLWWPEVFSGVPLWAQIEGSVLWFPQWIAYGLMEPYVAFNVLTCFHVLLSAVGSFLLGRACGLSGAGAALAGVVFGLCGFNIAHLRNPNLHSAAAMVPWVLWASERALRQRDGRNLALLGLCIGLQNICGMPQITYYTLLAVGSRWVWQEGKPGGVTACAQASAQPSPLRVRVRSAWRALR